MRYFSLCGVRLPAALTLLSLLAAGCGAQQDAIVPSRDFTQQRARIVTTVVNAGGKSYVVDEMYTPSGSNLEGIAPGPRGHIWFSGDEGVGESTIKGDMKEYPIGDYGNATSIVEGPDQNLWVTLYPGAIGRMSTGGRLTAFPAGRKLGTPFSISNGPDNALWFLGGTASNDVVRITTTGEIKLVHRFAAGSRLQSLTYGSDGKLWFTDSGTNKIGSMTASGAVKEYSVPTPNAGLSGICEGQDGNFWFLEQGANKVGSMTTSGSFHEYQIPTYSSDPTAIVAGPDGALWFTEYQVGQIGRITTSGTIAELKLSATYPRPLGITVGSDKNVWFTESQSSGIMGRVDLHEIPGSDPVYSTIALSLGKNRPELGVSEKFPLSITADNLKNHVISGAYPNPIRLTTSDSRNAGLSESVVKSSTSRIDLLFSGHYTDAAISANTRGGAGISSAIVIPSAPKEKKLPNPGYGVTGGPNNTVWLCLANGSIARYSTDGSVKSFGATSSFTEEGCSMLEGPDKNVWFTDYSNDRIGKITLSGQVTFFALGSDASPLSMALGSDGALWFTEYFVDKIGRLTTDGQLTTYNAGGSEPPLDIVAGPDGNLWYNDGGGNIYKLTTSGQSTRVRNVYEMGGLWSAYGHLWYWTASGFDLEEMSTGGSIEKTYPVSADCLPGSLTGGPQHSIWFVGSLCVARMTLSGKFSIVPMYSQKYSPVFIEHVVVGPKGYLWFNETGTNGLGWLDPSTM